MKRNNFIIRMLLEAKAIWHWLILGAILCVLSVLCTVAAPEVLGRLVQVLYDYAVGSDTLTGKLVPGLLLLAGIYALGAGLNYLNMLLMNKVVSRHYSCGLRIRISEKIKRLPVRYVDQTPVGDILSRMTGDVSEMGGYMHQIFDILVKGFFQILLIAAVMLMENWKLALTVILLTPLSVLLSVKIASLMESYYDKMFAQNGKLTEIVEESFSNYPTLKAFHLEEYSAERHNQANETLKKATAKANFMGSMVQPIIRVANALSYILITLIGGWLIAEQGIGVGSVVTVVLFARQFAAPLEELAFGFGRINQVRAASNRVFEILDMEEEEQIDDQPMDEIRGEVSFDCVDFSYSEDHPLIRDMNLKVYPGQKVAIVGPTGAGKTTIVNLLMRFYDPVSGRICLDGQDICSLSRHQVREKFGMVLQDTWLFRGTIYENLTYGSTAATREQVMDACKKTYCDSFIQMLPNGYDTLIGEDTTNLSGGQRQLLTIARALLANKPLLILDEATSNVDTRTEILIQQAMDELMRGRTCFVIAHRLSTIVDSDVILVLDNGRIVEQGTHRALLDAKGFYYKLYTSQYAQ